MDLFKNILDKVAPNPKSTFLSGFTQPSQPQVQPPAQVAPVKPKMTLFKDEYTMLGKMKADGIDDEMATQMIKKRRADLLGGDTKLAPDEQSMLLKMQADSLSAKEATAMIQKRRKDQFEKKYQEGNILQKGAYNALMFGAGNAETVLKYAGNALDFATLGMAGFGDDVKRMEQVTQAPEFDSTARKVGSYLPDVALAVSPLGGSYLAGAKGMGNLALRSGVVGAGFGATQPILENGNDATIEDIATGGVIGAGLGLVATPIVSKTLKYGQAGYYGGFTGMGKSIARDTKAGIQAITPSGANISTRANRFNANEIREFKRMTGESPGEFATNRGMTKTGDDAVVEATTLWQKSKEQADDALTAIKGRFKPVGEKDYLKMTIDDLDTRLTKTESPDMDRLKRLKAKYEDSGLTMSEINEVKRLYSQNHKYSFVDAGSEPALRSRNLQDGLRKWQFKVAEENGLTNLKEINKTTQGWKTFADSLSKKIQGSSGNNAISLTDWIALSGGSPENIALYLGKKLASSERVKQGAIKLFSKKTKPSIIQASIGDIQQSNFQKNVNRGVSGAGDNSGGKSMVRPVGLLPAGSKEAIQLQEEALIRRQNKKASTEQAKKIIKAEQAKKEAVKTPDITSKSKIVRPLSLAEKNQIAELKSLEREITKDTSFTNAKLREDFASKIKGIKNKMLESSYRKIMMQEESRLAKEYLRTESNYGDDLVRAFRKLKALGEKLKNGPKDIIESRKGKTYQDFKESAQSYINKISGDSYSDLTPDDIFEEMKMLTLGTSRKSPSPKPIVKNLQKTEKSAPIGDMETKKLIEPIKGVNFTRLKGLIEDIKTNNGGQKGVLGDFLEGSEMKKIYGDALDTPVYIFDESHPAFKTAENINKEGIPRAMTAFIEGGKLSNKGTPIIAIRGKISVDGLIKTLTEEGMHALQKLKGRKRIGSATAKSFNEYEKNANEVSAKKGGEYAMKIINRK